MGGEFKLNTVDYFNKLTDTNYENMSHFRRKCADTMHCVNNDCILALALFFTFSYIRVPVYICIIDREPI